MRFEGRSNEEHCINTYNVNIIDIIVFIWVLVKDQGLDFDLNYVLAFLH